MRQAVSLSKAGEDELFFLAGDGGDVFGDGHGFGRYWVLGARC